MNDVPERQEIHIHPTDLRSLSDKVYLEATENAEPRLKAIVAKFGITPGYASMDVGLAAPIGASGADYAGSDAGRKLMSNVVSMATWADAYVESMKSFATGLAVASEQSEESDGINAGELNAAFHPTTD